MDEQLPLKQIDRQNLDPLVAHHNRSNLQRNTTQESEIQAHQQRKERG